MNNQTDDEAPPPPYQTNCDGFGVLVTFDEAVVRGLLPPEIEPVDELSGGFNLYCAGKGYGLAPFTAFYFYVHVKGFDSSDGTKGRWLLQGVYGPDVRVPAAIRKYYGFAVRTGESRLETKEVNTIGIVTLAGKEIVRTVVSPKRSTYKSEASTINFLGQLEKTREIVVLQMPYIAEICEADPMSIDISAPAGDPLHTVEPFKMTGAFAFENFTFAWPGAVPAQQVKA